MKSQQGFAALLLVFIIAIIVVGLSTSVAFLSMSESQSSTATERGEETLQLVEGCMEDALLQTRLLSTYSGGTLSRPEGTCLVTVLKVGNMWTITTTTATMDYKRTIQVQLTRGTTIVLTSWKEL